MPRHTGTVMKGNRVKTHRYTRRWRGATQWLTGLTALAMFGTGVSANQARGPSVAMVKAPRLNFHETRLPNGLKVITLEDHRAPVVTVEVWYHVGSKDETPGKAGFAHMFEHLMFK